MTSITEGFKYYRVTVWDKDVASWFEHFKSKGVPCILVKRKDNMCALFAEGIEEGAYRKPTPYIPKTFKCIASHNWPEDIGPSQQRGNYDET